MRSLKNLLVLPLLLCMACDNPKRPPRLGPAEPSEATAKAGETPLVIKLEPAVLEAGEREVRCVVAPAGATVRWEHNGVAAGEGEAIKLALKGGDQVGCVVGSARADARVTRAVRLADTQSSPDTLRHARRVARIGAATLLLGRDDAGLYGIWRLERASGALTQVMPLPGARVYDGSPPVSGEQSPLIQACGAQAMVASVSEDGRAGLWRTDGTIAGSAQVAALPTGWRWSQVRCAGDRVVGLAEGGRNQYALWALSGEGAPREVYRVQREPRSEIVTGLLAPVSAGALLWWELDGDALTLYRRAEGEPEALAMWAGGEAVRLIDHVVGQQVVFVAHPPTLNVMEGPPAGALWRTDGSAAGTARDADVAEPVELVEEQGELYALGTQQLWRVGAKSAGIGRLEQGELVRDTKSLLARGEQIWFAARQGEDVALCEASAAGAARCRPGCDQEGGVCVEALVEAHDSAVWVSETSARAQRQPWRNGLLRVAGDQVARVELPRTMSGTSPATPARMADGKLYFGVSGGPRGDVRERWVTDGSVEGTRRDDGELPERTDWDSAALTVAEGMVQTAKIQLPERPEALPLPVLPMGSTGALVLGKRGDRVGLWVTNGTDEGTRLVMESGAGEPRIELPLGVINGRAIFVATDPVYGAEPWSIKIE
jgi:hypothetical protein